MPTTPPMPFSSPMFAAMPGRGGAHLPARLQRAHRPQRPHRLHQPRHLAEPTLRPPVASRAVRGASAVAAIGLACALLQLAPAAHADALSHGGGAPLQLPPAVQPGRSVTAPSATGLTIAQLALAQLGKGLDGPNSIDHGPFDASNRLPNAWCAEFAEWVWGTAGVDTGGLDGWAGSFLSYGELHGSYRTSGPRVGDAAVFTLQAQAAGEAARGRLADIRTISHVGIVVAVTPITVVVVNGDWGDGHGGTPLVRLSTFPLARADAGDDEPGMRQYLAGFIGPATGR